MAAISSISAVQRQPFAAAERAAWSDIPGRCGSDSFQSASSASSSPVSRASARTSSRRAAAPFVQAAKTIFIVEASPTRSDSTRASTIVPAKSSATAGASAPDR